MGERPVGQSNQMQVLEPTMPVRQERPAWWTVSPPKEFGVEGANRCNWCRSIFDRGRRSLAEVEQLRRVLMIEMTTPYDPPICDACYESVVGSAARDLEVGTSNHGPSNLLLRTGDQRCAAWVGSADNYFEREHRSR